MEPALQDLKRFIGERGVGRRGKQAALDEAQELIYAAWETGNLARRVALAKKALQISPNCADAYVLLAEEEARFDVATARDLYAQGVAAGERALGKRAFQKYVGYFWGILETRPYMRARAGLAACLWQLGDREGAVSHYRDMLRLNPNDNQGVRYVMATCLVELDHDEDLKRLLASSRTIVRQLGPIPERS